MSIAGAGHKIPESCLPAGREGERAGIRHCLNPLSRVEGLSLANSAASDDERVRQPAEDFEPRRPTNEGRFLYFYSTTIFTRAPRLGTESTQKGQKEILAFSKSGRAKILAFRALASYPRISFLKASKSILGS